jgi:di/tricarboxylate transporter/CRP-like cAMP-binding protein
VDAVVSTLRNVPLFAELPRDVLARLVSELEELELAAGQMVFSQGEPGDALFVVTSGAVEVREERGGPTQRVAILGPGDCVGEMALVTGDPRSATVVTLADTRLLRLEKDRFRALSERHPVFLRELARVLCRRIARTSGDAVDAWRAYNTVFDHVLRDCEPATRRALEFLATAEAADDALLAAAGPEGPRCIAAIAARHPALVRRDARGAYRLHEQFREHVCRRLTENESAAARKAIHASLAAAHYEREAWADAARHWLAAERWPEAARAIRRTLASADPPPADEVAAWLDRLPEAELLGADLAPMKASVLARAGRVDAAATLLQQAFAGSRLGTTTRDRVARSLATMYAHPGPSGGVATDPDGAGPAAAARARPSPARRGAPDGTAGPRSVLGRVGARLRARTAVLGARTVARATAPGAVALAVAVLVSLGSPAGLDPRAAGFLAVLAAATVLWAWGRPPDFVVAIGMGVAWAVLGIAPAGLAFGGFATSTWFLMLAVLGLAGALARSGLLYRITLLAVQRFPPTFAGQIAALATAGIVSTLLIPSAQARVTFMAPALAGLTDALRYPPRSRGSAGLAFAAFTGFCLATTLFLTGTPTCVIAWRMLPDATRAQVSWLYWLEAVAVLEAVSLGLALAWIVWRQRPAEERASRGRLLRAQLEMLGPPSREEYLTGTVALLILAAWITERWHGIDPAWVTLGGLCVLLAAGVLDRAALQTQVDWAFLLFMGMAFSLADLAAAVKIDRWLGAQASAALGGMTHPAVALVAMLLATAAVRFAVPWQTAVPLLTVALVPVAQAAGLSPLIGALVALKAGNIFLLPHQNAYYLTLFYGTEERAFTHAQARRFGWVYAGSVLVGFLASLPYWRAFGLVRP